MIYSIKPLLNFIIGILLGIIAGVLSGYLIDINYYEQILIGLLFFLTITVIQIQYTTGRMLEDEKQERVLWNILSNVDAKLSNIRDAYGKIVHLERGNLFSSVFDEKISELEKTILQASERGELEVDLSRSITSRSVLSLFKGRNVDVLRETTSLDSSDSLFSVFSQQYFYEVFKLVQSGKITEVKKLLVFRNEEQLDDPANKEFINFYAVTPRYSYRVIPMRDYQYLLADYRLGAFSPITVYGDLLVNRVHIIEANKSLASWINNSDTVRIYQQFFEACWLGSMSFRINETQFKKTLSPDQLFQISATK